MNVHVVGGFVIFDVSDSAAEAGARGGDVADGFLVPPFLLVDVVEVYVLGVRMLVLDPVLKLSSVEGVDLV